MPEYSPLVSIGLPTYNRPELLDRALHQLRSQSFSNLEIIVSDNASTDPRVSTVIQKHCRDDSRVRSIKREINVGPSLNFMNVCYESRGQYFMWAADDDQHAPHFVEYLLDLLNKSPAAGLAFCGMDIVNRKGNLIGELAHFSRFSSTPDKLADARRFLAEHEICGKANPIYGLFRREAVIDTLNRLWKGKPSIDGAWSADVVFVFATITKFKFIAGDDILFRKLKPTEKDTRVRYESAWYNKGVPISEYKQYTQALIESTDDEEIKRIIRSIMTSRLVAEIFIGKTIKPIAKLLNRIRPRKA